MGGFLSLPGVGGCNARGRLKGGEGGPASEVEERHAGRGKSVVGKKGGLRAGEGGGGGLFPSPLWRRRRRSAEAAGKGKGNRPTANGGAEGRLG